MGGLLSGVVFAVPFFAQTAAETPWQTMGLGGIAALLVGYLVKQNTDLGKAQAEHQRELVKLVADMSISQTVYADAIKDNAAANMALAGAMTFVAQAIDRDSKAMERMAAKTQERT